MSKRNAARFGETEAEANAFAIERYGQIELETLAEIKTWF